MPGASQRLDQDTSVPDPGPGWLDRLAHLGRTCGGWVPLAVAAFLLVGTRQAFTVPYTGLGLSPAQLILLLLGVTWVLTRLTGQRYPLGLGLLSGLIVVRLCVVLISYGLGSGRPLTAEQHASSTQVVVSEVVIALLVIVTATMLRSRRDVELVLRALVAGGALSSGFALTEFATGVDLAAKAHLPGLKLTIPGLGFDLVREGVVRAAGAAAQPLELAAVLTTLLPAAAACYFSARGRREPAWPWALAGLFMTAGAVVSLSRSVFVGLAAAGVVVALRWPVRRTAVVLAGITTAATAALLSGAKVVDAVLTLLTQGSGDYSLESRQVGRDYVADRVAEHFWWGQGPGTYDLNTQPVLDNQYLSQLVENGALGLLAFVGVQVCALSYVLVVTRRGHDPHLRELAVGLAGALTSVMVIQLVLDTAGFVQISYLTWLIIGLIAAAWRIGTKEARDLVAGPADGREARRDVEPVRPGAGRAR